MAIDRKYFVTILGNVRNTVALVDRSYVFNVDTLKPERKKQSGPWNKEKQKTANKKWREANKGKQRAAENHGY